LNGTFNAVAFIVLLNTQKNWNDAAFCFALLVYWPLAGLKA